MATEVAKLEAVLSASTRDFDRDIDRSGKKMSKFGSVAKAGALGAGAAIATGLGVVAKIGWDEYSQGAKVAAQTNAVLKSTAGIANVTAKEVSGLATSLMKKSGVDDEVIASGENMLLTFKNIHNEAGRGNDIFTQSTKTLLDMSTALGTDMNKSAIQLGKALNDPIKGISALARVGVTFTEGQKATIKSLVDSGHTMQAQKIILKELNSEFGGSAEAAGKTLPGQINILRETFNNWAGEMVAKTIPVIQRTVTWLRDHWPEISAAIGRFWATVKPIFTSLISIVVAVVAAIRQHWGTIGPIVMGVAREIKIVAGIITAALRLVAALLRGDWSQAWQQAKAIVLGVLNGIRNAIQVEITVIRSLMVALGNAALNGLRAGLAGVRQLVFNYVINPFVGAINDGAVAIKRAVTSLFHKVIGWVKDALGIGSPSKVFHEIGQNAIRGFINGVGSMAGMLKNAVINIAKSIPGKALGALGDVFGGGEIKSAPGIHSEYSAEKYLVPWAQREGISVTSIATGNHVAGSYHYKHRAIDVSGSAAQMAKFFTDSVKHFGSNLTELFYDPMGYYYKNGRRVSGAIGGHSDHVHIALDKGGWLPTGTNLITNNTGRPERVLGPGESGTMVFNFPNYVGSKQELMGLMREAARQFSLRNSRPAFGG